MHKTLHMRRVGPPLVLCIRLIALGFDWQGTMWLFINVTSFSNKTFFWVRALVERVWERGPKKKVKSSLPKKPCKLSTYFCIYAVSNAGVPTVPFLSPMSATSRGRSAPRPFLAWKHRALTPSRATGPSHDYLRNPKMYFQVFHAWTVFWFRFSGFLLGISLTGLEPKANLGRTQTSAENLLEFTQTQRSFWFFTEQTAHTVMDLEQLFGKFFGGKRCFLPGLLYTAMLKTCALAAFAIVFFFF